MAILAFGRNGHRRVCGLRFAACVAAVLVVGCALDGEQQAKIKAEQSASPKTEQASAAQGNTNVNVFVQNGPDPRNQQRTTPATTQPTGIDALVASASSGKDLNAAGASSATHAMSGVTVNVVTTTGGITPTLTGTTTGTATQNPTQTPTNTPTQTVTPETSASVPIGVALPGGNVSNQATATGRGTTDATKSDQISQQYTRLQAERDLLRELIAERSGTLTPKPSTQPAGALTPEQMVEDIKKLMREKAALQAELDALKGK